MREIKKSFFQSFLQLTILVYFFRQSTRFSTDLVLSNLNNQINTNDLYNLPAHLSHPLDLIRFNNNIENTLHRYNNINNINNSNHNHILSDTDHLNRYYRIKESRQYVNDIRLLNLIHKIDQNSNSSNTQSQITVTLPYLFIAPASFASSNINPKELRNLSETTLLINSIELNWNTQLTKVKKKF